MKIILRFLLLVTVASCNTSEKQSEENVSQEDDALVTIQIPKTGCFQNISAKDTFKLKVETFPNVVVGTLSYNFFEKDRSTGDFEGKLYGDTLVADYHFMSEGTRSTQQIVFLIRENVALEGHGEMEEKDGKMVFRDIKKIDFTNAMKLEKVSCVEDFQP